MKLQPYLRTLVIPPITPALARLADVRDGLLSGESFRSLGRRLKCDEKTIRRDYDKLCLPTDKLQAILEGADCEPILREHARELEQQQRARTAAERAKKRAHEVAYEQRSGLLSGRLKEAIIQFFKSFCLLPADICKILKPVQYHCYRYGQFHGVLADSPEAAIVATMPATLPSDLFELMAEIDSWLFSWLLRAEPDPEIRDRGITAALRIYERQCPMP
jgi:hypothetical protein